MDYYFISDPHFGHKNVLEFEKRPFSTVEEMDQAIIDNVNYTIKKRTILCFG